MQHLNYVSRIAGELAIVLTACCGLAPAETGSTAKTIYTIETLWGGSSNGDGGPAVYAILNQPEGIAVDANGNIYVADADDHRVRRISPDGIIRTFAGTGVPGFSGDGGPAESAQLNTPYGLCLDSRGNLYVADLSNARIRRITPDGNITTFAGGGVVAAGSTPDAIPATDAKFSAPRNVAVDSSDALYISDFSGQQILMVSADGILTTIAGTGTKGFSADGATARFANIAYPAGLAVDAKGAVYFADSGNRRVRRIYKESMTTVLISPAMPTGVALDRAGNLYVQDGRSVTTRVNTAGQASTVAIGGRDIFIDASNRVYTTAGFSLMRWTNGTNTLMGGAGTQYFAGDGGSAAGARFHTPLGLFRDSSGNLYIADSGNKRIRRITSQGSITTIAGTSSETATESLLPTSIPLGGPSSVVMNSRGDFFIADTAANRVRRIGIDGAMTTVAGTEEPGYKGDGWFGIYASLNGPTALAIDKDDNVYIADTGNNRIRKMKPVGTISTIAGGNSTESSDGTLASQSNLSEPAGLALDQAGNLYISDTKNDRIRVVDAGGHIRTIADAASAGLSKPTGLRVASNGDLVVADTGNNRILRIHSDGTSETLAGSGARGMSGDDGPAIAASLSSPADLLLEPDGSIVFTDSGNGRIRKLVPASVIIPPPTISANFSVVNGATFQEGPVAPGEMVSILGTGLGTAEGSSSKLTSDGTLPTELGESQILFDGRAAPLFYAQDQQVNAQVPYDVNGRKQTEVSVVVNGAVTGTATIPVKSAVPGLLTMNKGIGQAVALNQDGTPNSFENPALRGSILVLYGTGDGEVTADAKNGTPADATSFRLPVFVRIGGQPVDVVYAGKAPGLIGVMQINVSIPADFPHAGILDIVVTIAGESTQKGVTVVIR